MDDDTPTAWEEINPTRTVLAAQRAPRSAPLAPWQDPRTALRPATTDDFRRELTACLSLVGAAGMSEDDRREWMIAARGTLRDIPADLLERGCQAARRTCDHPSKIVPAILAEVDQAWRWRKENRVRSEPQAEPVPRERRIERPLSAAEIVEANELFAKVGLATRYRDDGIRYEVEASTRKVKARGPLRMPTRADYLELGVDAAVLDDIGMCGPMPAHAGEE